jgi:hypothetical protein
VASFGHLSVQNHYQSEGAPVEIQPLESLDGARSDTPAILKKLAESSRLLAELKGVAATIPNQDVLEICWAAY